MKKNKTVKINSVLIIVVAIFFLASIIKLSYVNLATIVDGTDLRNFADNRNTTKKTLYAARGNIFDKNGNYLAQTVNSYTMIAYLSDERTKNPKYPKHVVDKEKTAKALSEVFEKNGVTSMDEKYILERLKTENRYQVEFGVSGKNISEMLKSQIDALNLPGIDFVASSKRYYQMGNFASYLIGYAKKNDEGKIIGEMGIEKYYDKDLTGTDGYSEYQTDSYGYKLPNASENTKDAVTGTDIYLTIDNNIQLFVEQELNDLSKDYKYSWITFNVMNAKTGAIVASASTPAFDPNKLDMTNYLNPLVSYAYEPGSTMKIFSFMSAIENGIYDGSKTYKSGNIKIDDKTTIKDFNNTGWGVISYDQGFANSSNVAATNLALELGNEKLKETYEKLGFGKKTGINLPDEVSGIINFKYKTELATASFGQGITTTPIQNLQALTTIANNGVMLKPYIIDKIVDPNTNEVIHEGKREELGQVVSLDTVKKIQEMMSLVMTDGVTDAKLFKPKTIEIIGKTGTAQIANPKGGYLTGDYDYIKSFTTLFPKEDPKYIIYVSVKQLTGSIKGLANAVATVIDEIANYDNLITNKENITNNVIVLDNYLNTNVLDTEKKLREIGLNPIIIGDGKNTVKQYPEKETEIFLGNKVFILSNYEKVLMPNVIGFTRNEIITLCNLIGLKYEIIGNGNVTSTSIENGNEINKNEKLVVNLG